MSAPRFFIAREDVALLPHSVIALPESVVRHAVQARRLRDGDALVLFDGQGGEYDATLVLVGRAAHAQLDAHRAIEREVSHPCWLVQAIVAQDAMDGLVRKAVELGVAGIVPLVTERTQRVPAERVDKRVARWQQIAVAACEQCGRNRVPRIADVVPFVEWVQSADASMVILDGDAPRSLVAQAQVALPRAIAVGPEGGFTAEELQSAKARGASAVHLGGRVLRAETAAIAALATLEAIAGDAN